jgi:hypothetical protein
LTQVSVINLNIDYECEKGVFTGYNGFDDSKEVGKIFFNTG